MASPYYNSFMDETLGSDPNGNQKTWKTETPGFQPMGWGVQPLAPSFGASLGSYQQPQGGTSFQSALNWATAPNKPGYSNIQRGDYAGYIGGQNVFGDTRKFGTQPSQQKFTPLSIGLGQPNNQNSFGSFNPQAPNPSWAKPAPQKLKSVSDYKQEMNAKQTGSQLNKYWAGVTYNSQPKNQNLPPGSAGAVGYGKYVDAQKEKYNLGPGQKYQQFIKNGAIYAKNSADMKTLWQNYHALDNWPKVPAAPVPNTGGGGYDYGWYGGGGGGYSRPKYAENLPGAVWRINQ